MRVAILAVTALLAVSIAGCSPGESDAADPSAQQKPSSVSTSNEVDVAPTSVDAGTTDADASAAPAPDAKTPVELHASGGPICDVLIALYEDITTLPERVEGEGVSDEDIDAIIGPAEAMKGDLPGMVGTVLPILKHDVLAASVFSTAAQVEEYFARGTHDVAMQELMKSARTACDLPASWPEDA